MTGFTGDREWVVLLDLGQGRRSFDGLCYGLRQLAGIYLRHTSKESVRRQRLA